MGSLFWPFAGLLVGVAFLVKGADFLVSGGVEIAHYLKIPKLIVGILFVSFATTAPEFAVSLSSALKGHPELSLGNALGSVIVDDTLALPLGVLVGSSPLLVNTKQLAGTALFLLGAVLLCCLALLDGVVTRWEGAGFLLALLCYIFLLFWRGRGEREKILPPDSEDTTERVGRRRFTFVISRFFFGVAILIVGSELLVWAAVFLARSFQIPEVVIGVTMIALGTSLPEIATCITAVRRGHGELGLGDIIGADILNILWIIGASALASPVALIVEKQVLSFLLPSMVIVVISLLGVAFYRQRLTKRKALFLVSLHFCFLAVVGRTFFV